MGWPGGEMQFLLMVAGVILILKELIPVLQAQASGVIYSRGHSRKRVERAVDPERFRALCRNRWKAMSLGLLAIGIGIGWLCLGVVRAVMEAVLQVPQ